MMGGKSSRRERGRCEGEKEGGVREGGGGV